MLLQTNDAGELVLPAELVQAPPYTACEVERQGNSVVVQIAPDAPEPGSARHRLDLDFPALPGRFVDESATFRREELYGDDGR